MKRWTALAVAALTMLAAGYGGAKLLGSHGRGPRTFDPNASANGARKLAAEAIEREGYEDVEVACPERVRAIAHTTFTCEGLVPEVGGVTPVVLEVFSRLGDFVRVVDVGPEALEYEWCKVHGELKGRAACSTAYEAR